MRPQSLGYVRISARELDGWRSFATGLLGLQLVDRSSKTIAFRMDNYAQRLLVENDGGSTINTWGWEMFDAAGVQAMAAQIENAGYRVEKGTRALCDERMVKDLVWTADPSGNRVEFYHGPTMAADAFVPSRNISGFRTQGIGLGHTVLHTPGVREAIPYYRDVLGFGVSDHFEQPFPACFFHVNTAHHSFALLQGEKDQVHHLMLELFSMDDVGQGYDIALGEEGRVAVTLGRHTGNDVISFYNWSPSGFMIEYGWGAKQIDPAIWTPGDRPAGPSYWGHDRHWLNDEMREKARQMALQNARDGLRSPVQVLPGNHHVMEGVCPWWDANVSGKAQ